MDKLYPPQIENTLPAAIKSSEELWQVPFSMNRGVGDYDNIVLLVKTIKNNQQVGDIRKARAIDRDAHIASFDVSDLTIGQFYKAQLAYVRNENEIGYYSSIGIFKCTAKPDVFIHTDGKFDYVYGIYTPPKTDPEEREYSYRFHLWEGPDSNTAQYITSSPLTIHSLDNEIDEWYMPFHLEQNKDYWITYEVITVNNLIYKIDWKADVDLRSGEGIDYDMGVLLCAENNFENGYIDVRLKDRAINVWTNSKIDVSDRSTYLLGTYSLVRASDEDNYAYWQDIRNFTFTRDNCIQIENGNVPLDISLWKDITVKQGVKYRYALQPINQFGYKSTYILNHEGPVMADFEDMFLWDGERQLNIRFNPKVSSFKTTLLESKLDTLGGTYPFIFRNGNTAYKEFPINGLISYHSDPYSWFRSDTVPAAAGLQRKYTETIIQPEYDNSTSLTGENFIREREFKMDVLQWLSNGKPKLFRSPGEGNFIVRLMNVSMTPNDTLSRMLHSFSATAYEIDKCDYRTLDNYDFLNLSVDYKQSTNDLEALYPKYNVESYDPNAELKTFTWSIQDDSNTLSFNELIPTLCPPLQELQVWHPCIYSIKIIPFKERAIQYQWNETTGMMDFYDQFLDPAPTPDDPNHKEWVYRPYKAHEWDANTIYKYYIVDKDGEKTLVYHIGHGQGWSGEESQNFVPNYKYSINNTKYYNAAPNKEMIIINNTNPHDVIYSIQVGSGLQVEIEYQDQIIDLIETEATDE